MQICIITWIQELWKPYFFTCRSKEMIEIYKSVYCLRQRLLSLKDGTKIKKSSGMDISGEQSSSEHSEEEESSLLQQEASSNGELVYALFET